MMNDQQVVLLAEEMDKLILPYFPKEEGFQKRLFESMNYSYEAGGKRLRPILMRESYRMLGGDENEEENIYPFLAAMEMIHTYSRIHDDLPAVDNDDFRRGKPSNHKVFGETTAIFAGDALLNYAFEIMLEATVNEMDPIWKAKKIEAMNVLAKKAGPYGMLAGQMVNYLCENKESPSLEELRFIHEKKTAALIQAPLVMGAIFAGAGREKIARMEQVGYLVGVSFQIQDDILDTVSEGDKEDGGLEVKNIPTTYVALKGMEQAKTDQTRMSKEAEGLLASMADGPGDLIELIDFLISRKY